MVDDGTPSPANPQPGAHPAPSLARSLPPSLGPCLLQSFWEVVQHELDEESKRKLLLFWSGSSSAPALGFQSDPEEDWQWTLSKLTGTAASPSHSCVHRCCYVALIGAALVVLLLVLAGPGVTTASLPEASTCDRRLAMPEYESPAQLKEKLMTAIHFGCMGYDRV